MLTVTDQMTLTMTFSKMTESLRSKDCSFQKLTCALFRCLRQFEDLSILIVLHEIHILLFE